MFFLLVYHAAPAFADKGYEPGRLGYTIDVKETTVGYRTQYIALLRLPVVSPNAVLVTPILAARV